MSPRIPEIPEHSDAPRARDGTSARPTSAAPERPLVPAPAMVLTPPGRTLKKYVFIHDEADLLPGVLDKVLREFADSVVGIGLLTGVGSPAARPDAARAIAHALGREYLVGKAAHAVVNKVRAYVVNDLFSGGARGFTAGAVAHRHGVPTRTLDNPNDPALLAHLRTLGVELVLSISGTHLYGGALRALAPYGVLCCHPGLLPECRGLMPSFWALASGDARAGVTVHFAGATLHTGPVVVRREFRLKLHDCLDEVIARGRDLMAEAAIEAVRLVEAGEPPRAAQDESRARRFGIPTPADVKRFRDLGHRVE